MHGVSDLPLLPSPPCCCRFYKIFVPLYPHEGRYRMGTISTTAAHQQNNLSCFKGSMHALQRLILNRMPTNGESFVSPSGEKPSYLISAQGLRQR